jgi:hypothetical protein
MLATLDLQPLHEAITAADFCCRTIRPPERGPGDLEIGNAAAKTQAWPRRNGAAPPWARKSLSGSQLPTYQQCFNRAPIPIEG